MAAEHHPIAVHLESLTEKSTEWRSLPWYQADSQGNSPAFRVSGGSLAGSGLVFNDFIRPGRTVIRNP